MMGDPKPEITTPRLLEAEPEVSFSAWRRWTECNFQEALMRLGPGIIPRAPKDRRPYLVGNVVHKILSEHVIPHREPASRGQIMDKFNYESDKPGMMFKHVDDRVQLFGKAERILATFTPPLLALLNHAEQVAVEVDIRRLLPDRTGQGRFWMTGVLDLHVLLRDGRVVVLDYKTSESFDRRQLVWYAAILLISNEPTPPTSLAFIHPQGDGYRLRTLEVEKDEIGLAAFEAAKMATALKGSVFPSNPEFRRCKMCRVRGTCADSAYKTDRGRNSVHKAD